MQLTNEEIVKVFHLYNGCECIFYHQEESWKGRVTASDINRHGFRLDWWKLILTPLSKITDEHAIEICEMAGYCALTDTDMPLPLPERIKQAKSIINKGIGIPFKYHQYLISKGYAVPLWFGVDHWANGKTAIQLGIAIEKHETFETFEN